jgi:dTDP-4-dehydrorhamnose 3,5-epimerase
VADAATAAREFQPLAIPAVVLVTPRRFGDARGFFSETWNAARYEAAGIAGPFVQDNHSLSAQAGTLRGLHCQVGASVQGKLVRVVRGAIWDVAIDMRVGSPTYRQHAAAELNAANGAQLWIPGGFLHGFCTLEPDTEVVYKVSHGYYDLAAERGVIWNDSILALPWPAIADPATLSAKDAKLPGLADCEAWFHA